MKTGHIYPMHLTFRGKFTTHDWLSSSNKKNRAGGIQGNGKRSEQEATINPTFMCLL